MPQNCCHNETNGPLNFAIRRFTFLANNSSSKNIPIRVFDVAIQKSSMLTV
jgi:hypothetical protein